MNLNEQTVTIYYKGNNRSDKEALGYARPLRNHSHEVDITKDPMTSTQLMEIASLLGVDIEALVDKESDYYEENYKGMSFDTNNWLTIMTQNPEIIKTPIVFVGERGMIVESGRDVIKLGTAPK